MLDLRFRTMTRENRVAKPGHVYKADSFNVAWARQLDELENEIAAIKGRDTVVEACMDAGEIRNDGWPRSNARVWAPDIRLYVTADVGPLVFPCATYRSWQANLRAIGIAMQALRLMRERGIGVGTEQYKGYSALPPGTGAGPMVAGEWASRDAALKFLMQVGCIGAGSMEDIYRAAARKAHPDCAGGTNELMAKVNRARTFIEKGTA